MWEALLSVAAVVLLLLGGLAVLLVTVGRKTADETREELSGYMF